MNTIKKGGMPPRLSGKDVPRVTRDLMDAHGNVSFVARKLGVSRTTMYKFINRYKQTREAIAEGRETLLDIAESALIKNVLAGSEASIFFLLKTQGKKRGYSEKYEMELAGKDGGPVQMDLTVAQGQAAEELAKWRKAQIEKLSNGLNAPPTPHTS